MFTLIPNGFCIEGQNEFYKPQNIKEVSKIIREYVFNIFFQNYSRLRYHIYIYYIFTGREKKEFYKNWRESRLQK